ncbi:MAG: 4-phosphoerythronate dehydrogenase PdxB [bacterium]
MKIICATNMPFAMEAFSTLGETRILEGRHITAADVRETDILALRSTTKVNRSLLEGSSVRFVGTATIGTDHLDIPYFDKAGIAWCFAPGCNANSVSEYVTAALLYLACKHGFTLEGKTIGVVGVGNVGRRVVQKARALGMRVLMNDPPRERTESRIQDPESRIENGGADDCFVSLDQVLAEADIITVHVPLTKDGPDKTVHLADAAFFGKAKKGLIFLNAARGPVVDSAALLAALDNGQVSHVILDTWEGEPNYRTDLMARVDIATPHIAGHSFEGKVMGTVMVYREVCKFLGVSATWSHEPLMPPPLVPKVKVDIAGRDDQSVLREVVRQVYDLEGDDRRFRESAVADEKARMKNFDRLRSDYPERREFQYTTVELSGGTTDLQRAFKKLGFNLRS